MRVTTKSRRLIHLLLHHNNCMRHNVRQRTAATCSLAGALTVGVQELAVVGEGYERLLELAEEHLERAGEHVHLPLAAVQVVHRPCSTRQQQIELKSTVALVGESLGE